MGTVSQLLDVVFVYFDYILITSSLQHEHQKHLNMPFRKLSSYGLLNYLEKSEFGLIYLYFLNHRIDKTGARSLTTKLDAICNFLPSKNRKNLLRSIGMINFYHCFIASTEINGAIILRCSKQ